MNALMRQKKIIQLLHKHKGMTIEQLSKILEVSVNTIRSDIRIIVKDNPNIQKTHGRIALAVEPVIDIRYKNYQQEKQKIAQLVSKHLQDYNSPFIFGDSSTTTYTCIKKYIETQKSATIITNAIDILLEVKNTSTISMIGIGGIWWAVEHCFIGDQVEKEIRQYQVDIAIISASGLTTNGIYNGNVETTKIKQLMSRQAKETWLVVDSTKFDITSLVKFMDISSITKIFTEKKLPNEWESMLKNNGVQFFY